MAVFEDTSALLDLKTLSYKDKKELRSSVTENGGSVCFVVNEQCTLVVTSDASALSSNRLRSIQKHATPVVGTDYIYECLRRGRLLPVEEFTLDTAPPAASSPPPPPTSSLRPAALTHHESRAERPPGKRRPVSPPPSAESPKRSAKVLDKFRLYNDTDSDLPSYPDDFQVAKYSVFEKTSGCCLLELQSAGGRQFRVVRCRTSGEGLKKELVFLSTSEDAVAAYQALRDASQAAGLQPGRSVPPQCRTLGSVPLQQLLLEEELNTGSISQEVAAFVELLWAAAIGQLDLLLLRPVDQLSLNDVSRAEGLVLQAQRQMREGNQSEVHALFSQFFDLVPSQLSCVPPKASDVSKKLDLCQLIRDVLSVSEMSLGGPAPSSVGKYRALRCSMEAVPPASAEHWAVMSALHDSRMQVLQIVRVGRGVELETFKKELGNVRLLLHSSSPCNFVGILSRGLLLPHVGVEHHGIERTDVGSLGSGIYFSDSVSTTLKYSSPSQVDGSRLLLLCDVALGRCWDVHKRDASLTQAPEGHHSVHGVRCGPAAPSEFEDDEFVVYSPDQVQLKYVVQFIMEGEQLSDFSPAVHTSAEPCPPPAPQVLSPEDLGAEDVEAPAAGLLDISGQQLPLQAVHVKCRLMDLLSQVVIFQEYTNSSSVSIEAKFVFPLDESAAVCGFEAFINGKHVVGKVKEKEAARWDYRRAVEAGHGAYLLDQDAPDVFAISVGNLPPGATVLIKVSFVSELIVRDGSVLFSLPGSVAPWQESAALNQTTQVSVEKVRVTDEAAQTRPFHLDVSVEMPNEISSLHCITHKVKVKRTDCKAVLSLRPGQRLGLQGFQLSIGLSHVHLPRMWVERHPSKDSQACMLVFYPDFDVSPGSESDEVVLLLDTSESMKGECLQTAQRLALQLLRALGSDVRLNVVLFGTDHTEAFLTARPLSEARPAAESFIRNLSPVGGSTELWRPLRALSLLPPSRGVRNLLLLSDGHIQNAGVTLKLLRDGVQHSRLFTCGLSPTANRHMLRALAQAGGGAYEFFDTKVKRSWSEKVSRQVKRVASPGCSSVSVKWQQFDSTAPPPVQAPKQLHALFNDCHTLVYGFVPHCTQATLHGNLSGQELSTMVSTSELQKTRGTFLHQLAARALIRDYEDGSLAADEAEHEGKKAELKSFIVELSTEFSILSQFTSFVAVEERDSDKAQQGFTDIPSVIAEEDVDFLPYISWEAPQDRDAEEEEEEEESSWEDDCLSQDSWSSAEKIRFLDCELNRSLMSAHEDLLVGSAGLYASSPPPPVEKFQSYHRSPAPPMPPPPPPPGGGADAPTFACLSRPHKLKLKICGERRSADIAKPSGWDQTPMSSQEIQQPLPRRFYRSSSMVRRSLPLFGGAALPPPPSPGPTGSDRALALESGRAGVPRRQQSVLRAAQRRPLSGDVLCSLRSSEADVVKLGRQSADPDPATSRWTKIFQMQHPEGFWEPTPELSRHMNANVDRFVTVFLKNKGICSLGVRAHTDILRLVATLLVLQMMREEKLEEGKLLRSLFCLDDALPRPLHWRRVKKAVDWVRWADRQYPCIYSRLEFGQSWESSTRQLLGYEGLPPFSPLREA